MFCYEVFCEIIPFCIFGYMIYKQVDYFKRVYNKKFNEANYAPVPDQNEALAPQISDSPTNLGSSSRSGKKYSSAPRNNEK